MPFSGDTHSLPAGSGATDGVLSSASQLNLPIDDINDSLTEVAGRITTGLAAKVDDSQISAFGLTLVDDADAATARTTLGAQASDATLTSLSGLALAEGDVLYATAADTLARLPKGTAAQVLAMNAGATAPEWVGGCREFLDVTTLLADTTLTYSDVTAGQIIRTSAEGFAYEVAASGASDHHLTIGAAGVVKLYALPRQDGAIDLAALGDDVSVTLPLAISKGIEKVAIVGNHLVTPFTATMIAPLTIVGDDAVLTRTGAASSSIVCEINSAGFDVTIIGKFIVDADDNAPEALRFVNTTTTQAAFTADYLGARNVYTRAADGTIGARGAYLRGNFKPIRIGTAEATNINREAGTNVASSNGSVGILIGLTSTYVPGDVEIEKLVLDTISCDDAVGSGTNTDCDGLSVLMGTSSLSGLLTDKKYRVRVKATHARNCKGRIIKTQSGTTDVGPIEYIHEGMAAINSGFSLINPQAGVVTNIAGGTLRFRDDGASPFNGTYQGSVVSFYNTAANGRPQVNGNVGSFNIISDYVGEGLYAIIDASGGSSDTAALNISGITGQIETRCLVNLPAGATGTSVINIRDVFVSEIVNAATLANASPNYCIVNLSNAGHLGSLVPGCLNTDLSTRRYIKLNGTGLLGIEGPEIFALDAAQRGAAPQRVGMLVPHDSDPSGSRGLALGDIYVAAAGTVAFERRGSGTGAAFLLTTTGGIALLFSVSGTTITTLSTPVHANWSIGAGSNPAAATKYNIWFDAGTGKLNVNNTTATGRYFTLMALG